MLLAITGGLALGQIDTVASTASLFIMPFLIVMLFGVFLQVSLKNLKKAFKNRKVAGLSLLINFLWTPFLAYGLSSLFFRDNPDAFIALLMDLVTPCTDWYLVFTGLAGGHLALSTALLPWNLLLQLLLMPLYLFLFAGAVVNIDPLVFVRSFATVMLTPFIIAVLVRKLALTNRGEKWFTDKILVHLDPFQTIFLLLAITAMFASQGIILLENIGLVIRLLIPVTLFFLINFLVGYTVSKITRLSYREGTSLIITTLARNAPLAMTVAIAAFPGRTLIPLVLAVESLIELPLLFIVAQILLIMHRKQYWSGLE